MRDIFSSLLLESKHALITGAGSGINLAIAERFAAQGASVSIVGRNLAKAQAAASSIESSGGQATGYSADVRDMEALQSVIEKACAQFGPLDLCIAGAAGNFVAEAKNLSSSGFRSVIEIDLLGTFNTFRASYDHLRKPRASLIAISAVQSTLPMAGQAHVCAAKSGVDMLVRTLSVEWSREGIRCNAIAPGPIANTEGMKRLAPEGSASWAKIIEGIPAGRAGSREEVANLALFLSTDAASYINGTVITIDGGQSNLGSLPMGSVLMKSNGNEASP